MGWVPWGLELGFCGRGFQLMGIRACGVRPSGFLVGALYMNTEEQTWEKNCNTNTPGFKGNFREVYC